MPVSVPRPPKIYRKVVSYERYRVYANYDSFRQLETLECGHKLANKGSVGRAKKRQCKDCEMLRAGGRVVRGNADVMEVWNPDTEMPTKVPREGI